MSKKPIQLCIEAQLMDDGGFHVYTLDEMKELLRDLVAAGVPSPGPARCRIVRTSTNKADGFYCPKLEQCMEDTRNTCGRAYCDHYQPRNGRNGICMHYRRPLVATDVRVKVTLDTTEAELRRTWAEQRLQEAKA